MRAPSCLSTVLLQLLASLADGTRAGRKPANAILLSQVQALTLRAGKKTSHRRRPAVPQLTCTGGSGSGLYEVDVMRCSNSGHDYDAADVQWTCAASLPPEFKLGATDVVCEGHADADDEYVLKGSCAVEYRLLLTDLGQQKYGRAWKQLPRAFTTPDNLTASIAQAGFWILFCIVLFIIVRNWWRAAARPPRPTAGPGGAGGNDGDDGDGDDPPPPYDWQTPRKPQSDPRHQGQRWTPGFWSGALGGAAAAYLAGNRQSRQNSSPANAGPVWQRGESSNSNSPRPSSARYESTGFGSTRRR